MNFKSRSCRLLIYFSGTASRYILSEESGQYGLMAHLSEGHSLDLRVLMCDLLDAEVYLLMNIENHLESNQPITWSLFSEKNMLELVMFSSGNFGKEKASVLSAKTLLQKL